MTKVAGYCNLCRQLEIKLYGTVLHDACKKHTDACKQAGCKHPAEYIKVKLHEIN